MQDKIISPAGRPITSLGIGSRVRLINDPNSPVMVIVSGIANPQGVQVGWACGWFTPSLKPEGGVMSDEALRQANTWNSIQLAIDAIEVYQEGAK